MSQYIDVWERLFLIMEDENVKSISYVYRLGEDGEILTPYLTKLYVDQDLLRILRDEFGGGDFKLLIRRGRKMIFSGTITIVE